MLERVGITLSEYIWVALCNVHHKKVTASKQKLIKSALCTHNAHAKGLKADMILKKFDQSFRLMRVPVVTILGREMRLKFFPRRPRLGDVVSTAGHDIGARHIKLAQRTCRDGR